MLQLTNQAKTKYSLPLKLNCIKIYKIALYAILLAPLVVNAEGSKELCSNGGNRAYLRSSSTASPSYPFPTAGTVKVYVKAGETIYAGSSAQGFALGTINLRAPDGTLYDSGSSTTVGVIKSLAEETAGPAPNAGGYTPYTRSVTAAQEGVWEINFIPPNPFTNSAIITTAVNVPWVQSSNEYVAAFDVTVRNSANTAFVPGRVYTNVFVGLLGSFTVGFNGIFYIVTKDGYHYTLDNNGQAGNGFTFFSNNKGFRTQSGAPSYLSVNSATFFDVHDPTAPDTQSDVTHKLFFNTPAADMPATAKIAGGTSTWLLNAPFVPEVSGVNFTGALGTVGKASTATIGGKISFTTASNGTYTISMDFNQNGVYTDAVDRKFTGTVNNGLNQINWDGLDGLGNAIPHNAAPFKIKIDLALFAAEVHFPFFDVERNVNGIKLTRTNGLNAPDDNLYWDDRDITNPGLPSAPITNLTGVSSASNGHKWGIPPTSNNEDDFGNNRSIDTWAYVKGTPSIPVLTFLVQNPYVPNGIVLPTIFTPNGDGKNDTFFIKDLEYYPGAQLSVFNRWGNEVYRSNDYKNEWDGANLSEGTYYYTLKVKVDGTDTTNKGWIYLKRK